jgi:hypothetical protein
MKMNKKIVSIIIIGIIILITAFWIRNMVAIRNSRIMPAARLSIPLPKEVSFALDEENNSGESGTAIIKEKNGKITVTIALKGFSKDISQPAHIHIGECSQVGSIKYTLAPVVNGKSITTLNITLIKLRQLVPLVINIHKSDIDAANFTSCGSIQAP